jgi:hypothetical protein
MPRASAPGPTQLVRSRPTRASHLAPHGAHDVALRGYGVRVLKARTRTPPALTATRVAAAALPPPSRGLAR